MNDITSATACEDAIANLRQGLPPPPVATPRHPERLAGAGPLTQRLWASALDDCERNIVSVGDDRYFGAGATFGAKVFTRDIAISGLFGLNRLHPELMLASLRYTRRLRWRMGFAIAHGYEGMRAVADAPWEVVAASEPELLARFHTNSYARRTDDVIWLWAAADLFHGCPEIADWAWLLAEGERFFTNFYQPFHDPESGLYRGQSCFVDVHFVGHPATGYPQDWSIADCVAGFATSTNALYVQGMRCLALAAQHCGDTARAAHWRRRADELADAMRRLLRRDDGGFAYLRDRHGRLDQRRHALGEAWAVELGIVAGEAARRALEGYPADARGVPLFAPCFSPDRFYHDNSSWPFVSAWHCRARAAAGLDDAMTDCAGMLAYACRNGFQEVIDTRDWSVRGSAHQLWSAAAFCDLCRRAGLWRTAPMLTVPSLASAGA